MTRVLDVYTGTPVEFVPILVVKAWSVALWVAELSLLGSVLVFLPSALRSYGNGDKKMPDWTFWIYVAISIYLVKTAYVQFRRWGDPLVLEGLPVNTLIVGACLYARYLRRREGVH